MKDIHNLIYGFIVGDSFGLSILRNNYSDNFIKLKNNQILNIEKGCFSFMTTSLLAVIDSISCCNKINVIDILNKLCTSFILGKYTNNGIVYDIHNETLDILKFYSSKNNLNYNYNDNDLNSYCLSRVIPIVIYNYYNEDTLDTLIPVISLTNNNELVLLGAYIYYKYLLNLISGCNKYKALKINIPNCFSKKSRLYFKNILKGNIYYNDIILDDNIINVLSIVFYIVLNSDNYLDMFNMISNLNGNTNIYSSLICAIGGIIYGKENIPCNVLKYIKNKKDINKYIKDFERLFL